MVNTDFAVRSLQAVAMIVGSVLLLWSIGFSAFFSVAQAAQITNASDTLSNSATSAGSVHTIAFTTPNGLSIGDTIVVTFPNAGGEFDLSTLTSPDDLLVNVAGSGSTTAQAAGVNTWGVSTTTSTVVFETPTNQGVGSSTAIVLTIGGSTTTTITNPTATSSYEISIGGTMQDSGAVRVAIIDEVTVTASVDTSLQFTVNGVAQGQTVNSSATTTQGNSSNVALAFGTLDIASSTVLAQDLAVATNAANGFTVTVEQNLPFQSTVGDTIDGFVDGGDTNTPTGWVGPSANVSDPDTYGHWGLTSEDFVTGRSNEFSSDTWVAPSTSPIIVMGHSGPSDGQTAGEGLTRVGYQVEISALQEASNDYSTTLRYIATPVF